MTMAAIRLCYVFGAVVDAVVGTLFVFPGPLAVVLGLAEVPARPSERLALLAAAALMFGWTALLLWGARSPVARRGVLALTIFPVIGGLAAAVAYGWLASLVSTRGAIRLWSTQALLIALLGWGYLAASSKAAGEEGGR